MKIDFDRAVSLLKNAEDVLILTHMNPDGDTLGSGFALMLGLRQLGKRVKLVNNDPIPKKYHFLADGCKNDEFTEKFIVSVDVAASNLLGKAIEERYGNVDLAIDHHASNRLFAKETYAEEKSASACEIVYLLLKAMGVKITADIADRIYTGCSTDTGCFRYSNVTPRTHRIAAELIEYGADHAAVNVRMFETKSMNFLRFQQKCIDKLETYFDGQVSVISITRNLFDETGCGEEDCDAVVALSRQIEGVKIGLTFKEKKDGTFKVSVRTNEEYDASLICSEFGGGGHARAAGCQFNCTRDEAVKRMLDYIGGILK